MNYLKLRLEDLINSEHKSLRHFALSYILGIPLERLLFFLQLYSEEYEYCENHLELIDCDDKKMVS